MEHNTIWEFYPCLVDDSPASISVDLGWQAHAPIPELTQVYAVHLPLRDGGEHGLGTQAEAERLWPIEDALVERVTALGWAYVGRLRNLSRWQFTFYGAPDKEEVFAALVADVLDGHGQPSSINGGIDLDWDYYLSFFVPDEERWMWIQNRGVLAQLAEAGDVHTVSRPVDHRVRFESTADRDAFMVQAEGGGFVASATDDEAGAHATVVRNDPVELEHIHGVVMELAALAQDMDGEYEGWACPVERGP